MLLPEKGLYWSVPFIDALGQGYEFVDVYWTDKLTLRDLLSHRTGLAGLDGALDSGIPKSIVKNGILQADKIPSGAEAYQRCFHKQ